MPLPVHIYTRQSIGSDLLVICFFLISWSFVNPAPAAGTYARPSRISRPSPQLHPSVISSGDRRWRVARLQMHGFDATWWPTHKG